MGTETTQVRGEQTMADKSRRQRLEEMLAEDPTDTFCRYGLAMDYAGAGVIHRQPIAAKRIGRVFRQHLFQPLPARFVRHRLFSANLRCLRPHTGPFLRRLPTRGNSRTIGTVGAIAK